MAGLITYGALKIAASFRTIADVLQKLLVVSRTCGNRGAGVAAATIHVRQ